MTTTAVVLAGGLGTRLRPITGDRWPKPMTPFAWRGRAHPFLEYPLAHLRRHGIVDVVLCVGHLGGQIAAHFGDGRRFGLRIACDDAGSAQTATRVRRALRRVAGDACLVLCGDVYSGFDPAAFMAAFEAHPGWLLQAGVQADAPQPANIAWDDDGVVAAYGAPDASATRAGREAGVLAVRRGAFAGLPEADASLTADLYPRLIARRAMGAVAVPGALFDIGSVEGHARFGAFVAAGGAAPLDDGGPA